MLSFIWDFILAVFKLILLIGLIFIGYKFLTIPAEFETKEYTECMSAIDSVDYCNCYSGNIVKELGDNMLLLNLSDSNYNRAKEISMERCGYRSAIAKRVGKEVGKELFKLFD